MDCPLVADPELEVAGVGLGDLVVLVGLDLELEAVVGLGFVERQRQLEPGRAVVPRPFELAVGFEFAVDSFVLAVQGFLLELVVAVKPFVALSSVADAIKISPSSDRLGKTRPLTACCACWACCCSKVCCAACCAC